MVCVSAHERSSSHVHWKIMNTRCTLYTVRVPVDFIFLLPVLYSVGKHQGLLMDRGNFQTGSLVPFQWYRVTKYGGTEHFCARVTSRVELMGRPTKKYIRSNRRMEKNCARVLYRVSRSSKNIRRKPPWSRCVSLVGSLVERKWSLETEVIIAGRRGAQRDQGEGGFTGWLSGHLTIMLFLSLFLSDAVLIGMCAKFRHPENLCVRNASHTWLKVETSVKPSPTHPHVYEKTSEGTGDKYIYCRHCNSGHLPDWPEIFCFFTSTTMHSLQRERERERERVLDFEIFRDLKLTHQDMFRKRDMLLWTRAEIRRLTDS